MEVRRATMDDALAVLEWKNNPASLAASKNPTPVTLAEHLAWFPRAIKSPEHDLFIAVEGGRRIGMVRFDELHGAWLVSINIESAERGKGYGGKALRSAMAAVGTRRYLAEIKRDNLASIRTFERCGFRRIGAEEDWLHYERSY